MVSPSSRTSLGKKRTRDLREMNLAKRSRWRLLLLRRFPNQPRRLFKRTDLWLHQGWSTNTWFLNLPLSHVTVLKGFGIDSLSASQAETGTSTPGTGTREVSSSTPRPGLGTVEESSPSTPGRQPESSR